MRGTAQQFYDFNVARRIEVLVLLIYVLLRFRTGSLTQLVTDEGQAVASNHADSTLETMRLIAKVLELLPIEARLLPQLLHHSHPLMHDLDCFCARVNGRKKKKKE